MEPKPFSKSHVLKVTSLHIKKAIDNSIRKTFDRLQDRQDKSTEIMETLSVLHKMRSMMEDFESHNKHLYQGDASETFSRKEPHQED